ncbi:MAG: hypothetical protein B6242_01585 [Anaerolineaceae bacterium 4572_78]|nr:MAG: hypothetical protein B6242_01585 [Anaerolineaceae bacterium 4572_78]
MTRKSVKPFEKWTFEEVEDTFGLVRVREHVLLAEWLNVSKITIDDRHQAELKRLQHDLQSYIDIWNEAELKIFFIGILLRLVNYYNDRYRPFMERKLSGKIDDVSVAGVVDFMLASGKVKPKQPYFCLHEYKASRRRVNDPLGQLLIAMLCARTKNQNAELPLYGVYVEGRFWYFVIMHVKKYAVSEPYTSTKDDDLLTIFFALQKVKILIEKYTS